MYGNAPEYLKGDNYTITKGEISENEINKLLKYSEELDETEAVYDIHAEGWIITYKGKTVMIEQK